MLHAEAHYFQRHVPSTGTDVVLSFLEITLSLGLAAITKLILEMHFS